MPYKCEYDVQFACGNCKHCRTSICYECRKRTEYNCPLGKGKTYPEGRKVCRKCLFEPEEREVTEVIEISFPKTNCNEKESATTAVFPPYDKVSSSTVTATTLKNCICGGTPVMVCNASIPPYYVIKCPKCGKKTDLCGTHADAEKVWNAIATENITETEKVEPLKPCRCGVMPQLEYNFSESVWIPPYAYTCPNCGFTTAKYETEKKAKEVWNMLITENLKNCAIKDSGERRQFETGAVRDMAAGKGLMVVMPAAALLRLSKHYEHGAEKYGRWNYNKGINISSFMDSALRHIMKYLDGWDDEDHLAAAAFNILGAMEMEAHKPAMQDIPAREGAKSFNYSQGE